MAVTLDIYDLTVPDGELSNNYFPQGDLSTHLQGWLDAATVKVEADSAIATANHDNAAAAWVYHRAFDYIANQLAALPRDASEGDGAIRVSYAANQHLHYSSLAAKWLGKFDALRSVNSSVGSHFALASGRRGL